MTTYEAMLDELEKIAEAPQRPVSYKQLTEMEGRGPQFARRRLLGRQKESLIGRLGGMTAGGGGSYALMRKLIPKGGGKLGVVGRVLGTLGGMGVGGGVGGAGGQILAHRRLMSKNPRIGTLTKRAPAVQ